MESFEFDLDGDDDFYENLGAPKFVDLTAPDLAGPADDAAWFCLRIGCDQNHEKVDDEAIFRSFQLRVMAARSPNVRLQNAMSRRNQRLVPRCPQTAPAKRPRSRITRLSTATSAADRLAKSKKLRDHAIRSLQGASPCRTEANVEASAVKKKAVASPRRRLAPAAARKAATDAEKMATPKPKKPPTCTLRPALRQTQANVEAFGARKKAAPAAPWNMNARPKQEPFPGVKRQVVAAGKANRSIMNQPKEANDKDASAGALKGQKPAPQVCSKMRKHNPPSRDVSSRYLRQLPNPKPAANSSKRGQETEVGAKKRSLWTKPASQNGCDKTVAARENSCKEASAKANSNDNKENLPCNDEPKGENSNASRSEGEIQQLENNENVPQMVARVENKVNPGFGGKPKKTTNPKPFRLRTDERRILREANSEEKQMHAEKEVVAVPRNGDGASKNQRARSCTGELVGAKSVLNSLQCHDLESTKRKAGENLQRVPNVASRRTTRQQGNTMPGKEKKSCSGNLQI